MRHFDYINEEELEKIFFVKPEDISKTGDKDLLAHALGTTLYMPATRESIAEDIINKKNSGLKSIAICLEDAIGDLEIINAENSLIRNLNEVLNACKNDKTKNKDLPLIFIRVRSPEQMVTVSEKLGFALDILTGFIFPKFSVRNGGIYFEELRNINKKYGKTLYGMPILETPEVIYAEKRTETLNAIAEITDNFYDLVLNIRIGATDFSNLFGIRRGYDINIYNISVLRDCIGSIINKFGRAEKPYVISGPVWEYFSGGDRIIKPQLRLSPFSESHGKEGQDVRRKMIDTYIDGLLYEVVLDKANGLWGKTIIHPSHIIPVQSLYAVTHEEYQDAMSIVQNTNGLVGVLKSDNNNKMNEIKTHINWAKRVILRSRIFGVLNEGKTFSDLFQK